jgi:N-acetylmuramoyl-L-alanine amidase
MVREAEAVSRYEASLAGARVAIDPGHGPQDPGRIGAGGLTEAEAAFDLAQNLAEVLHRRGALPFLLRGRGATPTPGERAQHANDLGAEVCVSIHINGHRDPTAEGATCFYFGTQETASPAGQRLAELIQDQLAARVGLMDGRVHPMSFTILRETQMPAVQVEPCFITNEKEERLLADSSFRCAVAAAMAEGLERFFNPRGQARLALGDLPLERRHP